MKDHLHNLKEQFDKSLDEYFICNFIDTSVLNQAIKYSVLNGGKRIRPILCLATNESCKGNMHDAMTSALAIELFHCSTLIHDDLPCMDDDDLRRGKPTCHIQFGEANAVLAGDALIIEAFNLIVKSNNPKLAIELAEATGSKGVIAGQVADLAAERMTPSKDLIDFIHYQKTAILIRASIRMGAITANVDQKTLELLTNFGEKIGIAFQIQDDILDETSSSDELGKPSGSDLKQSKMTYPSVYGMQTSINRVKELTEEAIDSIGSLKLENNNLEKVALNLVHRTS